MPESTKQTIDKVKSGIQAQLRQLEMKEKRQAITLDETRTQIAALNEVLKTL